MSLNWNVLLNVWTSNKINKHRLYQSKRNKSFSHKMPLILTKTSIFGKCLPKQWRYYGPFCARQSFKGLFWQNGPVFGPFLPPESSFSLNLCKQRQHHLPWWLQHPHSQASLFQCWRQFINSNRLLFKSLSLKFQILFDSFFFLICLCEYILVAFYVNVQFRLGRKRGS